METRYYDVDDWAVSVVDRKGRIWAGDTWRPYPWGEVFLGGIPIDFATFEMLRRASSDLAFY